MRNGKEYYVKNLEGEIWKDVEGYNGRYMVSNCGRVKYIGIWHKVQAEKILSQRECKNGLSVALSKDDGDKEYPYVHDLVAIAFLKKQNNHLMEIKHIDSNKMNNNVSNLKWGIKSELMLNAFRTELPKNNIHNYLDDRDIEIIKNLCKLNAFTDEEIALCFEIESSEVCSIREGL